IALEYPPLDGLQIPEETSLLPQLFLESLSRVHPFPLNKTRLLLAISYNAQEYHKQSSYTHYQYATFHSDNKSALLYNSPYFLTRYQSFSKCSIYSHNL